MGKRKASDDDEPAAPLPDPPAPGQWQLIDQPAKPVKRERRGGGKGEGVAVTKMMEYAGTVSITIRDDKIPKEEVLATLSKEPLEFRTLLNFEAVATRGQRGGAAAKRCVMCGRTREATSRKDEPDPQKCVIAKQMKDVCDTCAKATWQHKATGVYFKWCQGGKRFEPLSLFKGGRGTKATKWRMKAKDHYEREGRDKLKEKAAAKKAKKEAAAAAEKENGAENVEAPPPPPEDEVEEAEASPAPAESGFEKYT